MPHGDRLRGRTGRRSGVIAALAVALLVGGGAGWWAASTLLEPPPDVLAAPAYTLVEARAGSVGQTLRLNAAVQWDTAATVQGFGAGVVTSRVLTDGDTAEAGAVLFAVDLRPVVVAHGATPAFRDLAQGARGDDVAQLQELLTVTGHYDGASDGVFGARLTAAVRAWQRSLGLARTGVVQRGDVVFVPDLPARLALPPDLTVGSEVAGAYDAVHVLAGAPAFTMTVSDQQLVMIEPGTPVDVTTDAGVWPAVVGELLPAVQDGETYLPPRATLTAPGGGPVCADACGVVPVGAPTAFPAAVQVVPFVEGVVVPAAAVVTDAGGRTGVTLADGTVQPVDVVASVAGSAAVTGVDVGTQVRTPGDGR